MEEQINMKKNSLIYGFLSFAILGLIYDVYYWSMRNSIGVLRNIDKVICLTSGFLCIIIILLSIIKLIKNR